MNENGSIYSMRKYPSPNPNVELTEIIYWSQGLRVKGLLAKPKQEGNYEALLYLRGGLQSVGMVRPARIAQFASHGLIVFAPYYRGNRGGEGRDEIAGNDRYDAIYAVDLLKEIANVDTVHLYGFSRGGLMALWTSILRDDIKSVATWAGVSSVFSMYEERVDMRRTLKRIIGGSPQKCEEQYEKRTPLSQINDIDAPVLIVHGTDDQHVTIHQAYDLEQSLLKAQKNVETWYSSGLKHHYPPNVNRQTVYQICQWYKVK